eukprot:TRINITY_DN4300_c2_g1_i1.p1 TRINITY_DN4300_c2_g1~~TRINITY_DN4300_c2_g1_i1.p1  ORF type:complete len:258 (+),score=52.23 TRINITY_DN4300_c2_g1_i1:58-831(+)
MTPPLVAAVAAASAKRAALHPSARLHHHSPLPTISDSEDGLSDRCLDSTPPPRRSPSLIGRPQSASQPTLRDVTTRLRYSPGATATYLVAMLLCAGLILVAAATDTMDTLWYRSLEALLTVLFALELGLQWWLQGDRFLQKAVNVAELGLLCACVTIFLLSLFNWSSAEGFLEALLLSLRYAAQCARLLFFIRSSATTLAGGPMDLQTRDNPNEPPRSSDLGSPCKHLTHPSTLSAPAHLRIEDDSASDHSDLTPLS